MKTVKEDKYLGDILTDEGKIDRNLEERMTWKVNLWKDLKVRGDGQSSFVEEDEISPRALDGVR